LAAGGEAGSKLKAAAGLTFVFISGGTSRGGHAPGPKKPRQKSKILAPHGYSISSNALAKLAIMPSSA